MGVAVTFIAFSNCCASTIEVVQAEAYAPLHIRAASSVRLVDESRAKRGHAANDSEEKPKVNEQDERWTKLK